MPLFKLFKCLQRQEREDFLDVEDFMMTRIIPVEIMEFIFAELNLKDIRSCSRTCIRWKEIINAMFRNRTKILIATGYPFEVGQRIEIVDLLEPHLRHDLIHDVPSTRVTISRHGLMARYGCVGGLLDNEPFFCGGEYDTGNKFDNGFIIGQPHKKIQMLEKRFGAAGVVFNDSTLWITGGEDSGNYLKSTEFVFVNQPPIEGPNLPFAISGHCMVQTDPNTLFIIGGSLSSSKSSPVHTSTKTWTVDPETFHIQPGPPLNVARSGHSCAKMILKDKVYLVVAGGYDEYRWMGALDSVEILDPTSKKGWVFGPQLPIKVRDTVMIPTPSKKGVILIGGYNDSHRRTSNLLFELTGNSLDSLSWNIMEVRMKFQRSYHVAFYIPDYLTTPKRHFNGEPAAVRDFSGGSVHRMEVPHRIFYDPRYGDGNRHNPHLTGYCSSQFKFPFYPKSRAGKSWQS